MNGNLCCTLLENVQSILNCASYSFEDEDTLNHDFNIELTDDDSPFKNDDENIDDNCNRNDNSRDTDYNNECKNENTI